MSINEHICNVFYRRDDYIRVLDAILEEILKKSKFSTLEVPEIIKLFFQLPNNEEHYCKKRDVWIKHFIQINCEDRLKLECIFAALADWSMEQMMPYVKYFINLNDDFTIFKSLPLIPGSCSWYGSVVPLCETWKRYLESLLPSLTGINFIEHKRYVQQRIERLCKYIEEEECRDIFNS